MPNNPGTRRAGATQTVASNKIVRGAELTTAVDAVVSTPKEQLALPGGSTPTPDELIPKGVIVMWSGLLAAIPTGWGLCDGTAGRPDLRDRFIYGWTAGVDPGGTGGTLQHLHPVGTLANAAVSAGTPAGSISSDSAGTPSGTINDHTAEGATAGADIDAFTGPVTHTFTGDALAGHSHTFTGDALANHTHTITGSTANNVSGDALPPYFKLAFIIKT